MSIALGPVLPAGALAVTVRHSGGSLAFGFAMTLGPRLSDLDVCFYRAIAAMQFLTLER